MLFHRLSSRWRRSVMSKRLLEHERQADSCLLLIDLFPLLVLRSLFGVGEKKKTLRQHWLRRPPTTRILMGSRADVQLLLRQSIAERQELGSAISHHRKGGLLERPPHAGWHGNNHQPLMPSMTNKLFLHFLKIEFLIMSVTFLQPRKHYFLVLFVSYYIRQKYDRIGRIIRYSYRRYPLYIVFTLSRIHFKQ